MTLLYFSCRRTSDRANCTACNSRLATAACSFALGGKKAGQLCDRAVCSTCAPNALCPPHQRLIEKKARA